MIDKIKEAIQLNNVMLMSMQQIHSIDLRFAGKILTKYGVSRLTGHFMALVLRYYSNLFSRANGAGSWDSSPKIKNCVSHLNVYNRIVNWTGEVNTRHVPVLSKTPSREREALGLAGGSRQKCSTFPKIRILSSYTGAGLLERILIQEKNMPDKIRVSGIKYTCLIHNTWNIAHNTMFKAVSEDRSSLRDIKTGQGDTGEIERNLQAKAKIFSYLTVQQNITALKSGDQYANTQSYTFLANQNIAAVKGYLTNNRFRQNRLRLEQTAENKGISEIKDERTTKLSPLMPDIVCGNETGHKAQYKTGISQGKTDIDLHSEIIQQGSLVLYKPVMKEAVAEEQPHQCTGFYEKAASTRILGTSKQPQAVNNIDPQYISQLADRILKILEKRIAIQKDRRGLL